MARISRIAHVVLTVKGPQASAKWYSAALGMEIMSYSPALEMAFLSFGTLDPDIALIKVPEGTATGSPGLSHTAMVIEGGLHGEEVMTFTRDVGARLEPYEGLTS